MSQIKNFVFVAFSTVSIMVYFCGCASPQKLRDPSNYLLNTDRNIAKVLNDIKSRLEENKYVVKRIDTNSGIIVTAPREFTVSRTPLVTGRQTMQLSQEGGSIKIRIDYDCNYSTDLTTFIQCRADDQSANAKFERLDKALISVIQPALMKH